MALILLTNDDGIEAEGLRVLERCLEGVADLFVVAPDRERSAVSHGLTVHSSLELRRLGENRYSVNGTPADCVIQALAHVLGLMPDLVVSGINHGANLGDDIMYSGTVAAAREASRRGIAALAVSQAYDDRPIRFDKGKEFIKGLVRTMLENRSDGGILLNVNLPVGRLRGVRVTRQGCSMHFPHFNSLNGPQEPGATKSEPPPGLPQSNLPLDYAAISAHYISVTPLKRDQTDYETAADLVREEARLSPRFRFPGIGLIR